MPEDLQALVARALAEDVGSGDVTTLATVPGHARARGDDHAEGTRRRSMACARRRRRSRSSTRRRLERLTQEGRWREDGGPVLVIEGARGRCSPGERTALNFLAHLSGVATLAARAARAVQGTGARVLDTRKTTPGLRALEKAAVAAGGAVNHSAGLYDAILIKENHIAAAGGIAAAVERARGGAPELARTLEIEVRDAAGDRTGARGRSAAGCCWTTWTSSSCAPR